MVAACSIMKRKVSALASAISVRRADPTAAMSALSATFTASRSAFVARSDELISENPFDDRLGHVPLHPGLGEPPDEFQCVDAQGC